eukprot:999372-Alexandrium_andersonii.AAC.1
MDIEDPLAKAAVSDEQSMKINQALLTLADVPAASRVRDQLTRMVSQTTDVKPKVDGRMIGDAYQQAL